MFKDEWNIHNRVDSKLESVKVKLINLVRKLEEPLKISLQNRRDRFEDVDNETVIPLVPV